MINISILVLLGISDILGVTLRSHSFSVGVVEWVSSCISAISDKNSDNQIPLAFGTVLTLPKLDDSHHGGISGSSSAHGTGVVREESYSERRLRRGSSITAEKISDIPSLLVTALNNHKTNIAVIIQILKAIRNLSVDQIKIKNKFSEENIVLSILKILKIHKNSEIVCEHIGWMLTNCTVSSVLSQQSIISNLNNIKNESQKEGEKEVEKLVDLIDMTGDNNENPKILNFENSTSNITTIKSNLNRDNASKNIVINREIVYCDVKHWDLIVACIENHINRGE